MSPATMRSRFSRLLRKYDRVVVVHMADRAKRTDAITLGRFLGPSSDLCIVGGFCSRRDRLTCWLSRDQMHK